VTGNSCKTPQQHRQPSVHLLTLDLPSSYRPDQHAAMFQPSARFRDIPQQVSRFLRLQPPHASSLRSSWAHRSIASALVDGKHASVSCSEDHILHRQQSLSHHLKQVHILPKELRSEWSPAPRLLSVTVNRVNAETNAMSRRMSLCPAAFSKPPSDTAPPVSMAFQPAFERTTMQGRELVAEPDFQSL
jgi:hypothetical protein